jgi:hypothetical protein
VGSWLISSKGTSLVARKRNGGRRLPPGAGAVFQTKACGLRVNRSGLARLRKAAAAGDFTVVRLTHQTVGQVRCAWLTRSWPAMG